MQIVRHSVANKGYRKTKKKKRKNNQVLKAQVSTEKY